ncbi:mechanosensitive ion channel family protein [Cytophagaceae bacterium YF14B1]|uniref:Mechanosensitive ion channel family protein n=1 Tax=Xanthocytophaga flava TaxID=3048013 RepID=A0AAE3QH55_9BACT|nr:mechanosensitive ion channel family protein [Xanthocytophaga flavus]MDJ1479287.1 mechanosensitive ion channel family protein [Xanthocytophaga flavus]
MNLQQFLNQRLLDNRVENILWCAGILVSWLLLKNIFSLLLSRVIYRIIKKRTENLSVTEFIDLLRSPFEAFLTLVVLYTAFSFLRFPWWWNLDPITKFGLRFLILKGYQVAIIIVVTWMIMRFVDFFTLVTLHRAERTKSPIKSQLAPFAKEVTKVFLFILGIFVILGAVFSLDVSSIIAGLGIGGLAVALAGKESLENLFASFTIFLDKPFVVGDTVQVGDIQGTVEKVGFRSTRIRTLDKSFLTLPNKMLTDQPLDNLTQRRFRRARYFIGLPYNTPPEKVKAICEEILLAILEHPLTRNEQGQVRFIDFGESSLNILILYFVETVVWEDFNAVKEEINYRIVEIVNKHGVSFAHPTRTIFLEVDDKNKDNVLRIMEK